MSILNIILEKITGYQLINSKNLGLNPFSDIINVFGKSKIKIIFDVGANEGQTTDKLIKLFPGAKVYSFEPGKEAFKKLLSKFNSQNVNPVNIGLGAKNEMLELWRHESSVTDSFLEDDFDDALKIFKSRKLLGKEKVEIDTIDNYCSENNIREIDFLKIDTQGFELKILQGAETMLSQKKIKSVLLEVCFANIYKGQSKLSDIESIMNKYGYNIVDFYDKARTSGTTIKWCDILFVDSKL